MNELDYKIIIELYKERNITTVSKKLYMTQPNLTRKIKKIEEELCIKILIRSKTGIIFTSAGEFLVKEIKKINATIENMKSDLLNMDKEIIGDLKFGCSSAYAQYKLPKILLEYMKEHPKVKPFIIDNTSDNIFSLLLSNKIYLAIVRSDYPNWNGEKELLYEEPMYLVYSKNLKKEDLNKYPRIEYTSSSHLDSESYKWLKENDLLNKEKVIRSNSIITALYYIKSGLGWGLIPEVMIDNSNLSREVITFKNDEKFIRKTYLLYKKEFLSLKVVSSFIEAIKKDIKDSTTSQ